MIKYTEEKQLLPPIEIGPDALSSEALIGVIENFIAREGTDYGWEEASHATKLDQIVREIKKGHIRIVFDSNTESVTLLTENDFRKLTLFS